MGESLSQDHVFSFLEDELKSHPAYDFFAPRPLLGYAEPMVVPAIEEVIEPVAEAEEDQMEAPVMDIEEELAALFGKDDDFEDDDFSDDDSERVKEEEVWRWEQVGARVEQGQQIATHKDKTITELTQQVQALQTTMQ
nr:hypothetical protein [Tanacetum cinerariifolium]